GLSAAPRRNRRNCGGYASGAGGQAEPLQPHLDGLRRPVVGARDALDPFAGLETAADVLLLGRRPGFESLRVPSPGPRDDLLAVVPLLRRGRLALRQRGAARARTGPRPLSGPGKG